MIKRLKSKEKSSTQESTQETIVLKKKSFIRDSTQETMTSKASSPNNFHPTDGDIVYDDNTNCISIFKLATSSALQYSVVYIGINSEDNEIYFDKIWTYPTRLANHDEISDFVLLLASKGYMWDSENKEVIDIEWKAEEGQVYYFIGDQGEVTMDHNTAHKIDRLRYEFGNYFETEEEAEEEAEKQRKRLLAKRIADAMK
jgi:hypothetical protein